ncbi:glycosyltransferase family 4 protein [Candidatus Microgenomates bacterium]|nr:glycosyltransferase family 4 protein [Candidatus Microgenomates bacterium]
MKILFLTRRYHPCIGGVEKHVLKVAKCLIKKGHEITVVSELSTSEEFRSPIPPPRRSPFGSPSEVSPWLTIPVGKSEKLKKFKIWWWLFKNRTLINQSDIVHAHDVAFWYLPFRFLYPKKRFYITFHGWEGKYPIPIRNKIIRKISEKLAWGNICVGSYIEKWYGTKPDYITYGGVSLFPPPRRSPFGSPSEVSKNSKILFIGRLEEDTGLPVYLKAIRQFKSLKDSKFKIVFLGDGKLRKEAEKYGKVLGFVENIRPYVLQSRFIFTSGYLSILEAMLNKKLVFAVDDNFLKKDYLEMAPFAKWIIIEKNPKKLQEKIKYYFSHPEEEKKLVNKAYNWVKGQTWEKVTNIYLKLWEK